MNDIAIYGAGKAGRKLLEMLCPIQNVKYFIDSDKTKEGRYIGTKKVFSHEVLQNAENLDVIMSIQSDDVETY